MSPFGGLYEKEEKKMNQIEEFYARQIKSGMLAFMEALEKLEQKDLDFQARNAEIQKSLAKVKERINTIDRQMKILSEADPE